MLTAERDAEQLLLDVADMRARIERTHRSEDIWEGKRVRGGFVDLEFIAQYLQLRHAARRPEVLGSNTTDAFERLAACGYLPRETALELIAATRLWRRVQGIVRLAEERRFAEAAAPEGLRRVIARAAGAADFLALKHQLRDTARRVHKHFATLIAEPAARAAAAREASEASEATKEAMP